MERSAIFIDGGYLEKLMQKRFDSIRIDMGRLSEVLADGSDVLRTYYYHCPPYLGPQSGDADHQRYQNKQRFFTMLNSLPSYQVRLGKLEFRGVDRLTDKPIFQQKRVDIMLGVDMVELAATRQIQRAILLAGDSDFLAVVEAVKRHGVRMVLWHGPRGGESNTVHDELWDACDIRHELTVQLMQELAL